MPILASDAGAKAILLVAAGAAAVGITLGLVLLRAPRQPRRTATRVPLTVLLGMIAVPILVCIGIVSRPTFSPPSSPPTA